MRIAVTVHPNSKKPRIEKDLFDQLHVYVREPPLEGKANRAVTEALAGHYQTTKGNIVLVSGQKAKNKVFEIG